MTSTEFKRTARIFKEAWKELEAEAIKDGLDIFSDEYKQAQDVIREKILSQLGFTVEEYRQAKELNASAKKQETKKLIEETQAQVKELSDRPIPEKVIEKTTIVEKPTITQKIINKIVKTIEKPIVTRETKIERVEYDDTDLRTSLSVLDSKLNEILNQPKVEPLDVDGLKNDLESNLTATLQKNINMLGMPDFRKLAMGLQAQIDSISPTETDPLSLHLDQGTPQTVTDGTPIFSQGITAQGTSNIDIAQFSFAGWFGFVDSFSSTSILFIPPGPFTENHMYTLPASMPLTTPQLLQCDSLGVWSWVDPPASGVTSVDTSDDSLVITPTTGAVDVILNIDHVNTWTAAQNLTATTDEVMATWTAYSAQTNNIWEYMNSSFALLAYIGPNGEASFGNNSGSGQSTIAKGLTINNDAGSASNDVLLVKGPSSDLFKVEPANSAIRLGGRASDRVDFIGGNGATAPSTSATPVFTNYYGGNTNALGDPVGWISILVNGAAKKLPYY